MEKIVILSLVFVFGGLAFIFAITGEWEALAGVAVLAVLVGAPTFLVMLTVRRARQVRQLRTNRRKYEEGLIFRFDQEQRAIMRGDADAGVFGAFQPSRLNLNDLPDAEQMRRQAWQPDLGDPAMPAVRPKNPAPWHLVAQYPTQHFSKQAEGNPHADADADKLR